MTNLNWKSVSGYIIGRSHVSGEEPCQDRALNFDHGQVKGIVVCDGAGSCKHSEQGAIAVTQAIENVTPALFEQWYSAENAAQLMEAYFVDVLTVEQEKIPGSRLIDFSCTLLTVLVKDQRYLATHVGDGVICQLTNNEVSVLSHPENGFYANETYFVTMAPLGNHFRVYKGEMTAPHSFIAMSDGAAISFYINSKKLMEKENTTMLFEHLIENPVEVVQNEFPDFLKLVQKNTKDDCAIAILVSHDVNDNVKYDPFDDNYRSDVEYSDDDYEDKNYHQQFFEDFEDNDFLEIEVLPRQSWQTTAQKVKQEAQTNTAFTILAIEKAQEKEIEKKTQKIIYTPLKHKLKHTQTFRILSNDRGI